MSEIDYCGFQKGCKLLFLYARQTEQLSDLICLIMSHYNIHFYSVLSCLCQGRNQWGGMGNYTVMKMGRKARKWEGKKGEEKRKKEKGEGRREKRKKKGKGNERKGKEKIKSERTKEEKREGLYEKQNDIRKK